MIFRTTHKHGLRYYSVRYRHEYLLILIMVITYNRRLDINRGMYGCQSCSWSAEQGKCFPPCCPRSRLQIWSHEIGSAVPSRISLPILHTQAGPDAYSWVALLDGVRPSRHLPSDQSRLYRITHVRNDGVQRQEYAGTGSVILKVV